MTFSTEQLQVASTLDAQVQTIAAPGVDDFTIFSEMVDHMAAVKRLMDVSTQDELDELCCRFPRFYRYAKILERIAAGIASGEIQVPE